MTETQEGNKNTLFLLVGAVIGIAGGVMGSIWFFFFQKICLEPLDKGLLLGLFVIETILLVGMIGLLLFWIRKLGMATNLL